MSAYLCKVCRSALVGRDYREYYGKDTEPFFMSFGLLQESAADGCLVCSRLLNRFSTQYRDHLREAARNATEEQKKKSSVRFNFEPGWKSSVVEVTAKFNLPNVTDIRHRLCLVPAAEVEQLIDSREISRSTGSYQSLATAKRWLDDCFRRHPSCAACSIAFNPTRLLDLGLGEIPQACLYEVPPDCVNLRYMALSHCWGGDVSYKLTESNLESMKTMIPVTALSKTLQDAITVARKLGIRYLWADTLCIMQDSKLDWQKESTRMGDVFRNSICTIAASAASSGDAGCFFRRDTRLIEPCKIQNPSSHSLEEFYCMDPDIWEREIQDSPLNSRGWVLQELLLSPRTLHFGRNQIFYTCRKLEACEAFPMGLPKTIRGSFISRISAELATLTPHHSESTFVWDLIVEYYAQRELTKGEDKLVAISGLAKHMSLVFNDEYIAGIWRKTLPWGLLWSVFLPYVDAAVRFPGYRAPSWSWASIDGRLFIASEIEGSSKYIELAEVQEVLVTSSVGDAITHINDGFIRLKGRLTTCCYHTKDLPLFAELWGLTSTGNQKFEGYLEPDTRSPDNEVVDLYCFPIKLTRKEKLSPELDSADCLLLQRTETKGNFRRVGKFLWTRQEGTDIFSNSCDLFDASTKSEDLDYEKTENGKKYIIKII